MYPSQSRARSNDRRATRALAFPLLIGICREEAYLRFRRAKASEQQHHSRPFHDASSIASRLQDDSMGYIIEHGHAHHCPGRLVHRFISSGCNWLAEIDRETRRSTAANENGAPNQLATASLRAALAISLNRWNCHSLVR